MEILLQDLRYAVRRLARSRGFTLLAVLTLALGIGANSAIFSVVNAVLLRPLPFEEPGLLDQVHSTRLGSQQIPVSGPDFLQMQAETRAYESLAAYFLSTPNLTGSGDPVRLNALQASSTFFDVLGVRPALGRTFTAEENEPGSHRVAVLSHSLWQRRFGGEADVLGATIQLDGEPYEVVGVMPPAFDFPGERELWLPLQYGPGFRTEAGRLGHFLTVIGRRQPGVSTDQAAADIAAVAARIEQAFPDLKTGFGGTAVSLNDQLVGDIRTPLLILLGAVGIVLLIACANVANLLLARAAAREGELAVRTALGAERHRLVRQLMTESLLLGLLGGAGGLLLSVWGTAWLVGMQPEGIPRLDEVRVDPAVVGFTLVVSVFTGFLFGLVPAYHITRGNLVAAIKEGGRGALAGRAASRTRGLLVVAETGLAVMLLVCAGLLIRSFAQLSAVELGFRRESTLVFDLALPAAEYPDGSQSAAFYAALEERLRSLPGVRAVGASSSVPMSGFYSAGPMLVEGRPEPQPGEENIVQFRSVTPDALAALGVPVLRGRGFSPADREGGAPVVLLSASAAERFFGGDAVVGQRVRRAGSDTTWAEVVGIVGDVRDSDVTSEVQPGLYFPHGQAPAPQMSLVIRTGSDPLELVPLVRRELQALDPNLPVSEPRTLEQMVGDAVSQPRFYMLLLSLFAGTALVLSAIGIFGVMSYTVAQKTREIGIRMALGAAPRRVVGTVVGRATALAGGGVLLGLLGALMGGRLLSTLLYGVSATDPATLAAVCVLLAGVAVTASYLPARRAVRVDPMVALRGESV